MTSAISIEHLCMEFGEPGQTLRALDEVSLEIRANEFFTLLGPSGCGKTTLLRLIAGFEQPSSGTIRLYGEAMQRRQHEGLRPVRHDPVRNRLLKVLQLLVAKAEFGRYLMHQPGR